MGTTHPRGHGSMDLWIHGLMEPSMTHGYVECMDPLNHGGIFHGGLDLRITGSTGHEWISDPWIYQRMLQASLDSWICESM